MDAYKSLVELPKEGKIRNTVVSNYVVDDHQEIIHSAVTMEPVAKNTIDYFQKEGDVMYLA